MIVFPFAGVPPQLDHDTITALAEDTRRWGDQHGILNSPYTRRRLDITDPARFCAHVWPHATADRLRPIIDWNTFAFLWDDVFADDHTGGDHVPAMLDVLAVLDNNHSPPRDVWTSAFTNAYRRICATIAPHQQARIAAGMREWMLGVALQRATTPTSVDRVNRVRRFCVAASVCLAFVEPALGIEVPDSEYHHPDLHQLKLHAINVLALSNDVVSAPAEQQQSNAWNTAITAAATSDLDTGIQRAAAHAEIEANAFENLAAHILEPARNPTSQLVRYIDEVRCMMVGNWEWSLGIARYHAA